MIRVVKHISCAGYWGLHSGGLLASSIEYGIEVAFGVGHQRQIITALISTILCLQRCKARFEKIGGSLIMDLQRWCMLKKGQIQTGVIAACKSLRADVN